MKPENVDQQLRNAVATLDRSGGAKYFFDIKRRIPNTALWSFWKRRIPVDDVDDVSDYCYREGGGQYEYRIQIVDADGKTPVGGDGAELQPRTISAIEIQPMKQDLPMGEEDKEIAERRKDIRRRLADLELKREEARVAREERRVLDSMDRPIEEEKQEDDDDGVVQYDPRLDPNSPLFNFWMAQQAGFPFGTPNPNAGRQHEQKSDMAILAQAMMTAAQENSKAMQSILTALLTKNDHKESTVEQMLKMKSLFPSLEPKDLLGMVSPMMSEMHKLQAESSKITMQAMADNQRMMNEKMLEMMAVSPDATENDIERVGKIMGVGGEVVAKVINAFRGNTKRGDRIDVPALDNKKRPSLPAPQVNGNGAAKELPPAEAAKQAIKDRVKLFLLTHEQEMLIESDPVFVVEKLGDLWMSFPTSLRDNLVGMSIDKVYETLHGYEGEIVDRILTAVSEDKSGAKKKWCESFWEIVKNPPDDDDGDDGDDDQEGEPEPEPTTEPEGAQK